MSRHPAFTLDPALPHALELEAETDEQSRVRCLATLKRVTELSLAMAENAAAQHLAAEPREPDQPDPSLVFARACSSVRQCIAAEQRIRTRAAMSRRLLLTPPDPRRAALRDHLHRSAAAEPDREVRNELRRHIDERIEEELSRDPDHQRPAADLLIEISKPLGFPVDLSKVHDDMLVPGPKHRVYRPGPPNPHRTPPPNTG